MAPSPVPRDFCRSFSEMGSRVFTSVRALQHCADQGKVGEVKKKEKTKNKKIPKTAKIQSPGSATCFHDNPASQRPPVKCRASLPGHLLPSSAAAFPRSLGVRSGSAEKRLPSASCRLLSVPRVHPLATGFRRSFLGPARSRGPASPGARLRASLPGRTLPGCVCPRYCSRFPEPAGAAGPCGPVLWRRSLSCQAAAGECGSGRRADACARCHRPGPRLRPRGRGCSGRSPGSRVTAHAPPAPPGAGTALWLSVGRGG